MLTLSADTTSMESTWEARGVPPIAGNKTAKLNARDRSVMDMLSAQAEIHHSGGTYQMVAAFARQSFLLIGFNKLTDPARSKSPHYHARNGRHSELHLITQLKAMGKTPRGGTVYVAGRRNQKLPNTSPCAACRSMLKDETTVRSLVYFLDGKLVKEIL